MDDIVLRPYCSADDEGCKDLERKATMIPARLRWLVDGITIHRQAFDYKISQFPDGFIVVAASASSGVVGMICVAVKNVTLHWASEPVRAAYIFDLRVAKSHQKYGLGLRLMEEAHKGAEARGATYAYLTVNGDNAKAQRLFSKFGYTECSERFPVGGPPGQARKAQPVAGAQVDRLDGDAAAALMQAELTGIDFLPQDLPALVRSPFFLGTFVAHDGQQGSQGAESLASVSLWDGSGVTSFWVSKFLFPASYYESVLFRYALAALGLCSGGLWMMHIGSLWAAGSTGWACGHAIPAASIAVGLWKKRMILNFILMMLRNKDGSLKSRGRIFAQTRRGPRGQELLKVVVERAKSELAGLGFFAFICNVDRQHPFRDVFDAPGNFVAKLMHRSLAGGGGQPLPRTQPADFHDPRDI